MAELKIKDHSNGNKQHGFLPSTLPWQSIDNLVDKFKTHWPFHGPDEVREESTDINLDPKVDISEDKKVFKMTAELPGLDINDVHLDLSAGILTLSGEKKNEKSSQQEDSYHVKERSYGFFRRSFTIPSSIDEDAIKADFKRGILTVEFPKSEENKPKQRKIKIETE
ncbi:MAG: HSP20 family protein [Paraglaciecola sp.]|jgi:HSP20 family protein